MRELKQPTKHVEELEKLTVSARISFEASKP
jgi:hypothetical protein